MGDDRRLSSSLRWKTRIQSFVAQRASQRHAHLQPPDRGAAALNLAIMALALGAWLAITVTQMRTAWAADELRTATATSPDSSGHDHHDHARVQSQPAGEAGPKVVGTLPGMDAIEVPTNSAILVFFDRPMDGGTLLDARNILINGRPLSEIPGAYVTIPDPEGTQTAITLGLSAHQVYEIALTTGISDHQGHPLPEPYRWRFATTLEISTPRMAPRAVVFFPRGNDVDIPTNVPVTSIWSTDMDAKSFTADSFVIRPVSGGEAVKGEASAQGYRVVYKPDQPLRPDTEYEVKITRELKSRAGLRCDRPFAFRFHTGAGPGYDPLIADAWSQAMTTDEGCWAILHAAVVNAESEVRSVQATVAPLGRTLTLHDSGDVFAHGDKSAGDGIYSGRFAFPPDEQGGNYPVGYTAVTADGKKTEPVNVPIYLVPRQAAETRPATSSAPAEASATGEDIP